MKNVVKGEPAVILGAVSVLLGAVTALLALTLHWDGTVTAAVGAVTSAVVGLGAAVFVRGAVTPNVNVPAAVHAAIIDLAASMPAPIVDAWSSDGGSPVETLLHLRGIETDGAWVGATYQRKAANDPAVLVGVNSRWEPQAIARFVRSAPPVQF